jgi:NhaA family Na+:H+ antiporter
MNEKPAASGRLFAPASFLESSRVAEVLRAETVGGLLLMLGAVTALVWANSPWSSAYEALSDFTVGPHVLHLHLSLEAWAADGLLAIFFFVAGLELKREFVAGELSDPRRAALPVVAAVGGMIVPALVYVAVNAGHDTLSGWAIPTATDIAFAVAVLALISSHLPSGLRTFLLTLAVVDDLLAITVIAVFYTDTLHIGYLALALVPLAIFALVAHTRTPTALLLLPLALATWALVHASGVHATVAGVLLAFAVPVRREAPEGRGLAEHLEHLIRPVSAGLAVPIFAFFAAGVTVGGPDGFADALTDPVALGIVAGLLVGKSVGVFGSTWLLARFTRADLDEGLAWVDVVGLSLLAGIGFTVSLLIGELAFDPGSVHEEHVKVGVLTGSVLAALAATVVLGARNRTYRLSDERADR